MKTILSQVMGKLSLVREILSDNTNMDNVKIWNAMRELSIKGRVPTMTSIAIKTGFPVECIRKAYMDFIDQGVLRQCGKSHTFAFTEKPISEFENILYEKQDTKAENPQTHEGTGNQISVSDYEKTPINYDGIIKTFMLVIGIVSALASVYYTCLFQQTVMSKFWAVILAVVVVGFAPAFMQRDLSKYFL